MLDEHDYRAELGGGDGADEEEVESAAGPFSVRGPSVARALLARQVAVLLPAAQSTYGPKLRCGRGPFPLASRAVAHSAWRSRAMMLNRDMVVAGTTDSGSRLFAESG